MFINKVKTALNNRFGPVIIAVLLFCSFAFITRFALLIKVHNYFDWTILNIIKIFLLGLAYDVTVALYAVIPLVIALWLIPVKYIQRKFYTLFLLIGFFIFNALLIFNLASEWVFWDEFSVRYNFIAVDYLVYTTEVISNIRQSYPVNKIIIVIVIFSGVVTFAIKPWLSASIKDKSKFLSRTKVVFLLFCLTALSYFLTRHKWKEDSNQYVKELSGDGLYEFGYAFWNNQLDYSTFYKTIPFKKAARLLKTQLDSNGIFLNEKQPTERSIINKNEERKLNVVLISVESLSADFLGVFGNKSNITPNLDALSKEGMLFTQLYASGTRTVRGLEALSLCIPPTPGQSIIKRQNNKYMFTLGNVFRSKGYSSRFIYGGYAYFDNMQEFFSNNGYTVTDRNAVDDKDITYQNAWGIADEDLFNLSLKELDKDFNNKKLFFAHIMTVSNHRPYTYPDNRIDIPSHTGRDGAVKYTDYAIGKFIRDAKKKAWFSNTLFIIVADHCASSAGKVELPVEKYHIPMVIYAPGFIAPSKFEKLTAQIDIGPTILGLLNLNYTSKFFGQDIFKVKAGAERAFISTYQSLGYLKNSQMVVLDPNKKVSTFGVDILNGITKPQAVSNVLINEAVANYQLASELYTKGLYHFNAF